MDEDEKLLCRLGSVAAASPQIGELAASEALHRLTMRVPEELRGSWTMVLQWSRFQDLYEMAIDIGDLKQAAAVNKMQTELLTQVY